MLATINKRCVPALIVLGLLGVPDAAVAADPENCLSCHRYRGLARVEDDGAIRLCYVNPEYYDKALGPHARLRCTDCHEGSEVSVVPHKTVSPVDCTRVCHLAPETKTEVVFAHDRVADMLTGSVHDQAVLDASNEALGSPLSPGQARCLLCHDEPTFQRRSDTWAEQEAPIARCNVCHGEELPIDTRYYYWHVHARSRPARSSESLVRVCALCHSNPMILDNAELRDATASYLASFHGKGMLLGSAETAVCLDCHTGPMQNVHMIQSEEQADSPTNAKQLANTCRSPRCHPTAGHAVGSAAVHLELASGGGIEYFIASMFIVLIVFTFGPSALLTALEMVQVVVGRHDPEHHRRRALAERLMADVQGRERLKRFTPHQRVQHWILFTCFTALVLTGYPIKFADHRWAEWVVAQMGGLSIARMIHRWAGVVLIVGCCYHIVYVGVHTRCERRRTGKSWLRTIADLPMVMRWDDWKDLIHLLGFLLFLRRTRPKAGRFSLEEKFEYFGVFWGIALLGVTGVLMWANAWTSRYLPGRVLTVIYVVHTFEAFLALLHVGIVHLISVIFAPSVFPMSPAMFTGMTSPEEMAEGHAAMLTEVSETLQPARVREADHG
ncbi:MAG TPA: cytochrome b/b6 domain-containing protein [Phycisphaerae bacterium]|nr:cytochrome b/b6 domain-containing protein [Phycisphaerae bacterium]